jgi:hypothetical protein
VRAGEISSPRGNARDALVPLSPIASPLCWFPFYFISVRRGLGRSCLGCSGPGLAWRGGAGRGFNDECAHAHAYVLRD